MKGPSSLYLIHLVMLEVCMYAYDKIVVLIEGYSHDHNTITM